MTNTVASSLANDTVEYIYNRRAGLTVYRILPTESTMSAIQTALVEGTGIVMLKDDRSRSTGGRGPNGLFLELIMSWFVHG